MGTLKIIIDLYKSSLKKCRMQGAGGVRTPPIWYGQQSSPLIVVIKYLPEKSN